MDKSPIEITNIFVDRIKDIMPVQKVILFGSYARGNNKKYNDIDIAVVVKKIEGNYLKKSAELFELGWEIDSRIEPVMIEEGSKDGGFYNSIIEEGILAYERK